MSPAEQTEWAHRLLTDFDALTPWRLFIPPDGMSIEQAYLLQEEVARLREARGERIIGYKVGCTSRVIREQLGIREPIFGRVFDTNVFSSGARLSHARFANLAIEGELAIRLSIEEPISAIASVFPVIELHHYVLPVDRNPLAALIASGGIHAGLVLAEHETKGLDAVPVVQKLEVVINGRLASTTTEPWTAGSAAATLRWLTARLAERGLQLLPGQIILTGSALPLFPVEPGSRVVADAPPLGKSSVEID